MRILAAVIREPGLSPAQLAGRTRVSERTVRRDLTALRRDGYPVIYRDGYQLQELLGLYGSGSNSPGQGLGGVYDHQLRLLRAEVPATVADLVERDLEAEAPAALAGLIAHVLDRRTR